MFDALSKGLGNPYLLLASCLAAGAAVTLLLWGVALTVRQKIEPIRAVLSELQMQARRERLREASPLFALFLRVSPLILPLSRKLKLDSVKASLAERYARAGWPGGMNDDELMALSLLISLLATPFLVFSAWLVLGVLLGAGPIAALLGLVGIILGPGLVSSSLDKRAKKRDQRIERAMPFVLELLVLSVRSGASLPIALQRVTIDYRDHPVGEEFKATLIEIEVGATMRQAFENLAQRLPIKVIRSFVDDILQSDELGQPIAETLERLANRVRVRRVQDATEVAGKAKVLVLVPGMLVLVASLILLFAPFIVRLVYSEEMAAIL